MKYKILEHPADLKIRAYGKNKKELFLNMAEGMQAALRAKIRNPRLRQGFGGRAKPEIRNVKVESSSLETLLVDFLSEVLYLIQVNQEIYQDIKFEKFNDAEIKAKILGKKVESFGEDIKGVTYHDLEIKQNSDKAWQATVLFDM